MGAGASGRSDMKGSLELNVELARSVLGDSGFTGEMEDKFNSIKKKTGKVTMKDFRENFPTAYDQIASFTNYGGDVCPPGMFCVCDLPLLVFMLYYHLFIYLDHKYGRYISCSRRSSKWQNQSGGFGVR